MNIEIGDILIMKKSHPCGGNQFYVGRVGMDFRIRCAKCGHEVMVPRAKVEKNIKKVIRDGQEFDKIKLSNAKNTTNRKEI